MFGWLEIGSIPKELSVLTNNLNELRFLSRETWCPSYEYELLSNSGITQECHKLDCSIKFKQLLRDPDSKKSHDDHNFLCYFAISSSSTYISKGLSVSRRL